MDIEFFNCASKYSQQGMQSVQKPKGGTRAKKNYTGLLHTRVSNNTDWAEISLQTIANTGKLYVQLYS